MARQQPTDVGEISRETREEDIRRGIKGETSRGTRGQRHNSTKTFSCSQGGGPPGDRKTIVNDMDSPRRGRLLRDLLQVRLRESTRKVPVGLVPLALLPRLPLPSSPLRMSATGRGWSTATTATTTASHRTAIICTSATTLPWLVAQASRLRRSAYTMRHTRAQRASVDQPRASLYR